MYFLPIETLRHNEILPSEVQEIALSGRIRINLMVKGRHVTNSVSFFQDFARQGARSSNIFRRAVSDDYFHN